jgi:hypothetical protein
MDSDVPNFDMVFASNKRDFGESCLVQSKNNRSFTVRSLQAYLQYAMKDHHFHGNQNANFLL